MLVIALMYRRAIWPQAERPAQTFIAALAFEEVGLEIGDTAFDVADRLAIINMFGAYAYTYDENHLDDFRELFTESPELVVQHEDRSLSQDVDTVMTFLAARKAAFQARTTNAATR